MQFALAFILIK